ncbi:MAG: response regulator transcription factor [Actinomycetales bacterium]
MAARVLVVEDDRTVSGVVEAYLLKAGLEPRVVADGAVAAGVWQQWRPDLVVLDLMLPGLPGLDLLRRMRGDADTTPVVVLSARGDEEDRIVGLEVGADDYLTKPFSPRELVLRIQGLLRRDEQRNGANLLPRKVTRGPLVVDTAARVATLDGISVGLTPREFDLLAFLVTHPGEAFGKRDLLRRVWGWDFGDDSTVMVHVRRLREKVEADPSDPRLILTVRGLGYRFAEDADHQDAS